MTFDELKTFITVVECKSFTEAAKQLNLAQPTVSLHVKNLENSLQVCLLQRTNKTFHLTDEGHLLYERALQLNRLAEQTKQELSSTMNDLRGTLCISASYTIGEYILPPIITKLQQLHPNLSIRVIVENTEDVARAVRKLSCDIGCIEGAVESKDLKITPFMTDELILVAARDHPLLQESRLSLASLQKVHWVTREEGSGTRAYTDSLLQLIGPTQPNRTIFSSNEGVKRAVRLGLGIAAVSIHSVKDELNRGVLKSLNIQLPPQKRTFSTICSPLFQQRHTVQIVQRLIHQMTQHQ